MRAGHAGWQFGRTCPPAALGSVVGPERPLYVATLTACFRQGSVRRFAVRHCGLLTHGHEAYAGIADRKSTRLNSSHSQISYAVFCLKKKKNQQHTSIDWTSSTSRRT